MKNNRKKLIKIKFITIFIIIVLCCSLPYCYATNIVTFVGDDEVEAGVSQTIIIHVTYSEEIGVLEGILSYDTENIEDFSVSSSYNGWTITYNESTGKFNTLYASGTTDDDVLEITYTLKEGSTSGYITLSDISLTTISYSTIEEDDITKTITAKASSNTDEDTTNTTTSASSSTTSNSRDSTTATSSLPYTGNIKYIIMGIIIFLIVVILVYRKLKYYKTV